MAPETGQSDSKVENFQKGVHVGLTEVATILNTTFPERGLNVTRQQVHMWRMRRDRNGFPERHLVKMPSGKVREQLKLSEVVEWYRGYKLPNRSFKIKTEQPVPETVDNVAQ